MGESSRRKTEGRPAEPSHKWLRSMIAQKVEARDLAAERYHYFKTKVEQLEKQLADKEAADTTETPAGADIFGGVDANGSPIGQ